MTVSMPDGWRISLIYPARGLLQQYRLQQRVTFLCTRCDREKTSQRVAIVDGSWLSVMCNGCCGRLLATEEKTSLQPEKATHAPENASPTNNRADEFRKDVDRLAQLLRARAERRRLAYEDRKALKALAEKNVTVVALRYAELLAEGESLIARVRGVQSIRYRSDQVAKRLAEERGRVFRQLHGRHEEWLTLARASSTAPDYLDALVMRHLGGKPLRDALATALKRRGLRSGAIDVPTEDIWAWLAGSQLDAAYAEEALPAEVKALLRLDNQGFSRVLRADANETRPNDFLVHPAVVERWEAQSGRMYDKLRLARDEIAETLGTAAPGREGLRTDHLEAAVKACARAGARSVMAELLVKELRLRAVRFHRALPMQQLRAECLREAAAEIAGADPKLAALVESACADHRAQCPRVTDPHPCATCAHEVVSHVHAHQAGQTTEPTTVPTNAPGVERTPAVPEPPEKASAPSSAGSEPEAFICSGGRQHPAPAALAVVSADTVQGTPRFGYAWMTEDGDVQAGFGKSTEPGEGMIHVICKAALALGENVSRVRVVTRDAAAAAVVQHVLRTGTVPRDQARPLTEATISLLVELAVYRQHISVYADPCPRPHRGDEVARHFAALALAAADGPDGQRRLRVELEMVARSLGRGLGGQATRPDEEGDHALWVSGQEGGAIRREELAWRTALHRMHIDGGWCALPEPRKGEQWQEGALRLRMDHEESSRVPFVATQGVTLRRRGGQWELGGIRWPQDLTPGVIVTFRWRLDSNVIKARTTLLPQPECVDDVEFRHRYDAQVVTRESAPGSDQDREVPDLSDASWVLRTLRKLGYLSVDGVAMLAEPALIRNCMAVGMPRHLHDRVPKAVEQLLRAGRLERVEGSLDADGRPWYPPRPGHVRSDLLRYVPRVHALEVQRDVRDGWGGPRHEHWVAPFVRRLPLGAEASDGQMDAHRDAVRASEVVDRPLPQGYTFVRRHRRNGLPG
ncbi:hypothetical protein C7C45_26035 [Micromonospora arborensis]|uniref:Uncharacterized protein n=1 Tax=Micromonospora arborensis TaxID=2116518 RepID=A0A318NWG3_9ACTN|nr:hypothetical protein [Micromonospora arborensis]PYC66187.1 hypothetical protein C7C45_26035 [Micromonospora arborensis]